MREVWALDDAIHFLNHGSYGATPRAVLAHQAALRARLESEPVRFMAREYEPLLDEARRCLAAFIGAREGDLVFVTNATTGVNAVLRSLRFEPGDELLTTSHGYNACMNVLAHVAETTGARVVVAEVPFPLQSVDDVIGPVLAAVTPKTRLVLLDQITSPTALIFPVDFLVRKLEGRGIPVLIDAAHAPGQVPLHLDETGASFTTGNLHKWVCAPKGAAFLHVRRDRQRLVRPPVISHGANSPRTDKTRFQLEFDWCGTFDPTAVLSVPRALELMGGLVPGGWPALMHLNRTQAIARRAQLLALLGTPAPCPDVLVGAMASLIVPWPRARLGDRLFSEHHVEAPVISFGAQTLVRFSVQRHVRDADFDALAAAFRAFAAESKGVA